MLRRARTAVTIAGSASPEGARTTTAASALSGVGSGFTSISGTPRRSTRSTRCAAGGCEGIVKSDTVMFGEPIPPAALRRSAEETWLADCFITIGTSAVVYPAAQYPLDAMRRGVPLIEVNPEQTPLSDLATVVVRAPSGDALPAIVAAVRAHRAAAERRT